MPGRTDLELAPGKYIGEGHPVFVIAEIGQNHQGDVAIAKELIRQAKICGADAVKFQKSDLAEKFTAKALEREYDSPNSFGRTYGDHKRFLEFSSAQYEELQAFCLEQVHIPFTASAMDPKSVDFLAQTLAVPFLKIGSGDSNNFLLLEKVARMVDVKAVISTGMADFAQVNQIYEQFKDFRGDRNNFVLLQCTSSYPTAPEDVNLNVIDVYQKSFPDIHIGYSGHELGYVPTLGAVAKGAKVIERHFTLDKTMKGSDHACSLNPAEFAEMVQSIRILEKSMGVPGKTFLPCEKACFSKLGKSVVTGRKLEANHILNLEDLKVKVSEPHGWPASDILNLVGKTVARSLDQDEAIAPEDVISVS